MTKIAVIEAATPAQLAAVAALLRDYLMWMHRRHGGHIDLIDACFTDYESEIDNLAHRYETIVLALVDGAPAGCAMLRYLPDGACEMKRLFVRPAFQSLGLARMIVQKLSRIACKCGYKLMRLETGARQTEAQELYDAMGFRRIAPYYACPEWRQRGACFFEANTCAAA